MDYKSKTANDKEISIYYFSATGNSLKLSQDIAAAFGGAGLFRMTPSAGITASDSRIVGFIFPVYMGGLPGIVRRFLESYPFRKGVYYFSIGTYYTYKGCAVSVVDKIMSGKGVRLDYGFLALFDESGKATKAEFIVSALFGREIKVIKLDKGTQDFYMRLTTFHSQFRAIGTNYNQCVRALKSNFSEKKALAFLYKLERHTLELVELSKRISALVEEFQSKYPVR